MGSEERVELDAAIGAGRTIARLARIVERACRESGLNLQQYRLLVSVSRSPQRAGVAARQGWLSRPSLTALVDGLETRGLVRRVPVEGDRRGIQLELTEDGREILDSTEARIAQRLRTSLAGEDPETVLGSIAGLEPLLDHTLEQRRRRNPVT